MSATSNGEPENWRSLVDAVHRRVGRNLLMFQVAEESLRFLLPYIHPNASANGLEAMRTYAERSVTDKSLGILIEQFKQAAAGDKHLLADDLKAFVDARNQLVHHFYRNSRFNLLAADGIAAAIAYLDEQHEQARVWADIFRAQALAVVLELAKMNPKFAADLEPYRKKLMAQAEQLFSSVEIAAPGVAEQTP